MLMLAVCKVLEMKVKLLRSFILCTHPQISLGRSNKESKVGGTCGTHGRREKSPQAFGGKSRIKEITWKIKA
jgi:hypothetical protein